MQKNNCGIYKITNNINGHSYIGQSIHILQRFQQHKKMRGGSPLLYNAIKKYGIENFTFQILQLCQKQQLNEKQIYWINFYNTFKGEGYNLTEGGETGSQNGKKTRIVSEEDVINIRKCELNGELFKDVCKKYSYINPNTLKRIWQGLSYTDIKVQGFTKQELQKKHLIAKSKQSAIRMGSRLTEQIIYQIRLNKKNGISRKNTYQQFKEYFNTKRAFDGVWYNQTWKYIQVDEKGEY